METLIILIIITLIGWLIYGMTWNKEKEKRYQETLMVRKYGKAGEGNVFTDMDSAYNKVYEKDINKRES